MYVTGEPFVFRHITNDNQHKRYNMNGEYTQGTNNNVRGPQPQSPLQRKKFNPQINVVIFAIAVLAVLAYFFKPWTYFNGNASASSTVTSSSTNQEQTEKQAEEAKDIIKKVRKVMVLPDEEPVMYMIDNPAELIAQQAFFTGTQKGDILMIFPKSAKAVIYSKSRNVIVNAGPVTYTGDETSQAAPQSTTTPAQ